MSFSKSAHLCGFCNTESGLYTCPRCNRKYCSSSCYKSPEHGLCSESFYQEWVESTIRDESFDQKQKGNMMKILKKCYEESLAETGTSDELSIDERFGDLGIEDADENDLWQKLTKEERDRFTALTKDSTKLEELIPLKQPWWVATTLNLVTDFEKEEDVDDDFSRRPIFPLNVKKISELSSKKPSNCLQFNLVNIIYAYAFLNRFYNCELGDFLEEVLETFYTLCPVLFSNKIYSSLEESVQDTIRLILSLDLKVSMNFVKSIVNDVNGILKGPNNAKPSTFVICALNDVKIHLMEGKKNIKDLSKNIRKEIKPAVKKIEYFMSWSLNFESILSSIASDLLIIMMPDLVKEPEVTENAVQKTNVKNKPIIEEIS